MANEEPTVDNPVTGQVLFYNKPEPLSVEAHGNLGVKTIDQPFEFLRQANAVPITVTEFGKAALNFPIIFLGETMTPVAVMGINAGQNLFVNDDGRPDQNIYLPDFVRRYPFVFAGDETGERFQLCIDREAPMISDQPEVPFFNNGEVSDFTNRALEFCKQFEQQRRMTLEFNKLIAEYDLFEQTSVNFQPRDANGQPSGPEQKITDYTAISESKLNALDDAKLLELRNRGALGAIYSHLVSLLNWQLLIQRALIKAQNAPAPAGAA